MKGPMLDFTRPMTKCERCGQLIALDAERRNEDSRPFRLAKVPKGVCANCVMTQFLYNTYPINMQIDEAGPQLLLNPLIRDAFLMSGLLANSDLKIDEISWEAVVKNWDLPVKIIKSGMNPYRMGESPAAQARKDGHPMSLVDPQLDDIPLDVFAGLGKQQYCPKCGQPAFPSRESGYGGGYMTECHLCGYKGNDVHLRDIPTQEVQ